MKAIVKTVFRMGGILHNVGQEIDTDEAKVKSLENYGYVSPVQIADKSLEEPPKDKMVKKSPKKKGGGKL